MESIIDRYGHPVCDGCLFAGKDACCGCYLSQALLLPRLRVQLIEHTNLYGWEAGKECNDESTILLFVEPVHFPILDSLSFLWNARCEDAAQTCDFIDEVEEHGWRVIAFRAKDLDKAVLAFLREVWRHCPHKRS